MELNYSYKEYIYRVLWWLATPFFRYSPRLFYSWRNFLLRLFGAKIGDKVKIYPTCKITFPWKLKIGSNVTIAWDVRIYNLGYVDLGDNIIISQNSHLCAGTHDYRTSNFELIKSFIKVKKHVWIAADSFIGPNVTIENNCIIGARSVLLKNTTPQGLYAGNPAERLKNIDGVR